MRRVIHAFWVVLALLFLLEAWLWEKLAPIVAFVVGFIPLRRIKANVAAFVERLPPAATLIVFVIPAAVLFPIKIVAIWMFGHGQWLGGICALVFAKLAGLGVTAFIFEITRPKLLQLAWFARLYEIVLRGLAWAHELVEPVKRRMRKYVHVLRPRNAGRFYRHLMRVRRRMHQAAAPAE